MRRVLLTVLALGCVAGCGPEPLPLAVVEEVEVDRYLGKWYEIASYPNSFQRNCTGTTADYSLNDNGTIAVLNTCYTGSLDGPAQVAEGVARVVNGSNNAKLKVRFFVFDGDYWIIELGDENNYGYAVVSEPQRNFLWILSRTPTMDDMLFDEILGRLEERGFDLERLRTTEQDG